MKKRIDPLKKLGVMISIGYDAFSATGEMLTNTITKSSFAGEVVFLNDKGKKIKISVEEVE